MSTGLFDTIGPAAATSNEREPQFEYRALSGWAISSLILAVLSPLVFADWWLAIVPIAGLVVGLIGWRRITVRHETLSGSTLTVMGALVSAVMLIGGLAFLTRIYVAELPEGYERINYAMLQPLEGDPPTAIPESAKAVDGHDVLLKGYMYPGKKQRQITQFLLVRDQGDCCFGGNPKITDRVLVTLRDVPGIDFTPRLVKIAGRFVIRPMGGAVLDEGVLYHLEDAFVR